MKLNSESLLRVITSIGVFGACASGLSLQAYGQGAPADPSPIVADSSKQMRQFSAASGALVAEAQELMRGKHYDAALEKLNGALKLTDLTPYEVSIIYQMRGSIAYEQGRNTRAITDFEKAIESGGLTPEEASTLRLNIGQLLIVEGKYEQGATILEAYMTQGHAITTERIELIISGWIQAQDYERALPWAERWLNEANPKQRKHFDLLYFIYSNLKMVDKQEAIIVQMVDMYPEDKTLWENWAALGANSGRERDAFEVTKLMYIGGMLDTEDDVMKIVQYYSFYEMPFQAAKILEREMNAGHVPRTSDRLVMLSDLHRQARDYKKAIPVLENAARLGAGPKVYAQLGEALYHDGQCGKSEAAFRKAIDLGYNRAKAWSLIATCLYESSQQEERVQCDWSDQKKANSARQHLRGRAYAAFGNVPQDTADGKFAVKWQAFIQAEERAETDRCKFLTKVVVEECFKQINASYRAKIITGGELQNVDEKCRAYIAKFDEKYKGLKAE